MRFRPSLICLAFLLSSCDRNSTPSRPVKELEPVVKVGTILIGQDMVDMRAKMLTDIPTISDPQLSALAQLVSGMLSVLVLGQYGHPVTEDTTKLFWATRKDSVPQKLREIEEKTKNKDFFLITMVLPELATILTHDVYLSDEAHPETIDRTQKVLQKALSRPKQFDRIAKEEGLPVDRLWISGSEIRSDKMPAFLGRVNTNPSVPAGENAASQRPGFTDEERQVAAQLFAQLGATAVGQVHPRAIQTPDAFQVVRVEAREYGRVKIALMTIEKAPYEQWFWNSASKYPVEFTDVKLGKRFLTTVPWGKQLLVRVALYPEIFAHGATNPTPAPASIH